MIFTEEMKWFVKQIDPASEEALNDTLKCISMPEGLDDDTIIFYKLFIKDLVELFEKAPKGIMDEINMRMEDPEGLFFFEPDIENFRNYSEVNEYAPD